jgi:O-antigen/teichoic acid export membrane protein
MVRLIKYLLIFGVLAALGLVAYAYIGPWFGADFSVPVQEIRKPVVLDAN